MVLNPRTRSLIFTCFALASLTACGGTAQRAAIPRGEPSPTVDSPDTANPRPAALTPASPAAAEPARRNAVPLAQMRGLSGTQITEMLGKPQFLRQDSTAELWQYRGESCVLHLFLYRANDEWRVRHAEARPRAVSGEALKDEAAESCLAKLAAALPAATS